MQKPVDPRTNLLEQCDAICEHAKLLRDYGTTPGNVWLANGELSKISQLITEIETTLKEIKADEEATG